MIKGAVTSGGFAGLVTPCQQHSFDKATLDELFADSLPTYLKDLGISWGTKTLHDCVWTYFGARRWAY